MTWVRSPVAAGLSTDYSVLGGKLTQPGTVTSSIGLDWIIGEVIDKHCGHYWKQVIPSITGGDFRRLPTLNKIPLPLGVSIVSGKGQGSCGTIGAHPNPFAIGPNTKLLGISRYHINSSVLDSCLSN